MPGEGGQESSVHSELSAGSKVENHMQDVIVLEEEKEMMAAPTTSVVAKIGGEAEAFVAANKDVFFQKLVEELECGICTEIMHDPVLIAPC